MRLNRREFGLASGWGLFGGGISGSALTGLSRALGDEAPPINFGLDLESVIRAIERTPREQCVPLMLDLLKRGMSYRQFLGGLFLAGIRNVNPRPPGFKFHCVMAMNAVNQMSLDAEPADRLLPLAWALDQFKSSQADDASKGDFELRQYIGEIPVADKAWEQFHAGMKSWNLDQAEGGIISLVRNRGSEEVLEGLWLYGARDYRNIGHKAIIVANAARTLDTIGWEQAEPVLRSAVSSLLDFGPKDTVNLYAYEDQCYLPHVKLAEEWLSQLPGSWGGTTNANLDLTRQLVGLLNGGDLEGARKAALQALKDGKGDAGSVWDAVHLGAGELMLRQRGLYGIHVVTSTNALHYAYRRSSQPQTRLVLMLQGLGWVAQFHKLMSGQKAKLNGTKILELKSGPIPNEADLAAQDILYSLPQDPAQAAARAFAYGKQFRSNEAFLKEARRLILRKATDAHDFKYAAAIFEDMQLVQREWQPHLLAVSTYHMPGVYSPESKLLVQAREALKTL